MFSVLDITQKIYFRYRNSEDKDPLDYVLIKEIFEGSKNTYGYSRIAEGLKIKYGVIFNHKKVARIMQKYYLKPEYIKRIRPNLPYNRIQEKVKSNLIKKINMDSLNHVWTTEIIYLIYNNKRLYLSAILDLYDIKVVAYKIPKRNDIQLVTDNLNEAIIKRKMCTELSSTVTRVSNTHLTNTKIFVNPK